VFTFKLRRATADFGEVIGGAGRGPMRNSSGRAMPAKRIKSYAGIDLNQWARGRITAVFDL
jgi:hypothetical protein